MVETFQTQLVEMMPSLRAFGTMLCRSRDRAEYLTQDTMIRALSKEAQFQPGTNLKAWLFTIMRNLHIDAMRQRKREAATDLDGDMFDNLQVSPASQDSRLILKELLRSMDRLNNDQREVLSLVGGHGLAYEEAAAICKCPVGTVRSRLARARRELEYMMMGDKPLETSRDARRAREVRVLA